ncbi:MAG: ATP-binding protein [Desulfobacteraceae bacterium]
MSKAMYREFKRKMVMLTLLISIVPLILLGYTIYYEFAKIYNDRNKQHIASRIKACVQSLDLFLEERQVILSTLAKSGSLGFYNKKANLRELFETINTQTGGGLIDLGVIDSSGDHLAYIGPYNLEGLNYKDQEWFNQTMIKGLYISDVYMGYRQLPHFVLAVKSRDNDENWILRATIDPEVFVRIVKTAQTGNTGDAFIINQEGILQSPSRFKTNKILEPSGIETDRFGSGVTFLSNDPFGKNRFIHAGMWLNHHKWLLVVTQNTNENLLYVSALKQENFIIFFTALLAIVATTIAATGFSVSKLQERDKKLDEMNAQLIQTDKLAALGKMAAGVAHEINNPLGIISNKAGWMKTLLEEETFQKSENFQEYYDAVEKIEEHVERAGKVTHNMLGFARSMEPSMERININEVITQTLQFLDHHARINNIKIEKSFDDSIPDIKSDRSQLQQVFLNIINNAVDAIDKEGFIFVTTFKDADKIIVTIKDTGQGLPENIVNKIFDPFFTTKEKGHGTGLGLSITHRIIEQLGGRISVKSKVNQGTTFTIVFPLN